MPYHPLHHDLAQNLFPTGSEARLLDLARYFVRASLTQALPPLLQGKHLGLLGGTPTDEAQALFRAAAESLGGRVAVVHTGLSVTSSPREVRDTARLLDRLYDAVECQDLDPMMVGRIAAQLHIPVFEGAATPRHPTARLAQWLDDRTSWADSRRFVLQALLVESIA